jgi:hypothetical protein
MKNNDRILELLDELNTLTLNEFLDNLKWEDIKHFKCKQPSGTPIYRHFVTIPQYYPKGIKDIKYRCKPVYGGRMDEVDLNNINYRSYVITKIKNKLT